MTFDIHALPTLTINMEHGDSPHEWCQDITFREFEEFTVPHPRYPDYGWYEVNASVLIIPDDIEKDWWSRPESALMRRKVRHATKLGYRFAPFQYNDHLDDLYAINTSKQERQGRPMDEAYHRRPEPRPVEHLPCRRHRYDWLGVLHEETLVGYILAVHLGEMVSFSMILGHGDHLEHGIMYLLVYETVKRSQALYGTRYAVYNWHDGGTEGMQFFKRKMGFSGYLARFELSSPPTPATVGA